MKRLKELTISIFMIKKLIHLFVDTLETLLKTENALMYGLHINFSKLDVKTKIEA